MSDDPSKTKILPDGPAGELPPGATLSSGMYRVTGLIASGGFGITYEARDNLDRKVAIKECFPAGLALRSGDFTVSAASASNPETFETARNLFLREARTLAVLRHPNIVHVQTLFEENGTAYMAMDYVDGSDLEKVIDNAPDTLTPTYILELTRTLLGALDYLHRDAPDRGKERLLHRDIKPANIRIDPLGAPVIIDFGAAKQKSKERSRAAGTFRVVSDGYSPVEFYVAGANQGPASDLYSLAATLYHCITGAKPPPADERAHKVDNGVDDPYEPLAGRFPGHDPRLLGLIDRAMARPLKDRPVDAAAWLAAIPDAATRIVDPESVAEPASSVANPPPPPPPAPSRGGFWKGAVAGGAVLALLGGGTVALAPDLLPGSDPGLRAELEMAQATIAELEAELTDMSGSASELGEQVASVTAARDLAQARAQELGNTVNDLRAQLRAAGDGGGEETTALRNQLNQAVAEQEGALEAQRELEARVTELETALDAARAAAATGDAAGLEIARLEEAQVLLEEERDSAVARVDELRTELVLLETQLAQRPDPGADDGPLSVERDAAIAARDAAITARDAARRDVERAQSDLQRMAANLSEAEAEAARLNMELRAARAEIDRILTDPTNTGPINNGGGGGTAAGLCPTWVVPGQQFSFVGDDLFSPDTLTTVAGGSIPLFDCTDIGVAGTGFVNSAPDFTITLTQMARYRRLSMQVIADCDATLLVNTSDGVWHFNDDANGTLLPALDLTGPQAIEGQIDVWVGTFSGESCPASVELETWFN